ncbi:MAG: hypothetical protein ACNFW9_04170 [Candidatus Kerfeldbacteria bacterium]
MKNKTFWFNGVGFASAGAIVAMLAFIYVGPGVMKFMPMYSNGHNMEHMNMDEHRDAYLEHKDKIQNTMRDAGMYTCCLDKSCTYCIEKDPKHGEGASCTCIEDIVNGVHPCGECIGEILEGHGNKYLTQYFAKSIAEELGEKHIDVLRQIISEKYDISIDEQL